MKPVKVTELRQNLPQYLARVRRGERIRVTSRGKTIAELAPPSATQAEIEAARKRLKGSLVKYERPFDPAADPADWEANK
jgi:prevent-host-death family protein